MTDKDQIIIAKVLSGNTNAYTYLVNDYKDFVFTIAFNIVKNREDAEDIAQESFVKAYKQLHTFKGDSKFSTWLYTITFRTAISANRKLAIAITEVDDYVLNNFEDDDLASQITVLNAEDQKYYIEKAMKNLPELDALVLTLYYLNEHTTEEIEKITGFSKVNIKVRMHRARKKLADSLKEILPKEAVLWR